MNLEIEVKAKVKVKVKIFDEIFLVLDTIINDSVILSELCSESEIILDNLVSTMFTKETIIETFSYLTQKIILYDIKNIYSVANFLDYLQFSMKDLCKICKFIRNINDHKSTWPHLMNLVEKFPNKDWDYLELSKNKAISYEFMFF